MAKENYPALTLEQLLEKELYESFKNYDNYELVNSENREFKYQLDSDVDEIPIRPRIYPVISDQNGEPYVFRNAETDELFINDEDGKLIPYGEKDENILSVNTSSKKTIDLTAIESVKQNLIKLDDYPTTIYQETNYQIKKQPEPTPEPSKSKFINIEYRKILNKLIKLLIEAGFEKKTQQKVIDQLNNNIERATVLVKKIELLKGLIYINKKIDNKLELIEDESIEDNVKLFRYSINKQMLKIAVIIVLILLLFLFIKKYAFTYHKKARVFRYLDNPT